MRNKLKNVQYLMFVLFMFALTGCGGNNLAGLGNNDSGKVTAKFVIDDGKSSAKTVGSVPAGVVSIRLRITGPYQIAGDTSSSSRYPAVKATFPAADGSGSVAVAPGTGLIVIAEALSAGDTVLYEKIISKVSVAAGATKDLGTIVLGAPPVKEADKPCQSCHENSRDSDGNSLVANYKTSRHYNITTSPVAKYGVNSVGCAGCHGPQHNDLNPAASGRCFECHNAAGNFPTFHAGTDGTFDYVQNKCYGCHNPHTATVLLKPTGDVAGCTLCHAIGQNATANGSFVNDNSGVRAITPEFTKRSHHITGGAPTDAQCVVCHLEGKVVSGAVVVDTTKHMADASIHLRNVDTNADFVWSGTEHSAMDNFCFSCHDTDGAKAVTTTFTGIAGFTGTASNPFGDTLTNGYDQVARAGVVDVKTAFTTTNASHHAVSGQRYKYRFSTAANAAVWAARTGKPVPDASQIAEGHTDLDGNPILATEFEETMTGDFTLDTVAVGNGSNSFAFTGSANGVSQYLPKGEGEATLYEASKFVASYIPLGASLNVADNSTLHCGDCHTIGQWKAGSSTNADGSATSVAIGAHGSANEYLLRNSLGTDAIHNNLTYVCFNCHVAGLNKGTYNSAAVGFGALHPVQNKNQVLGYATTHAVSAFHIQCLADSANNVGATDRLAKSWEGDKTYLDYVPSPGATAALPAGGSDANSGNITGIACTNCHNSGLRSGFGGIHGGDNTYVDGLGRTQKSYRFMPGMGNYRYAPPGGWDGKDVSNPDFVTVAGNAAGIPGGKPMGGCYTNGSTSDTNPGYSACSHHGTNAAVPIYGGGTTQVGNGSGTTSQGVLPGDTSATKTTWEPTVREATAGNALVTRPLKY